MRTRSHLVAALAAGLMALAGVACSNTGGTTGTDSGAGTATDPLGGGAATDALGATEAAT